MPILVLVRHGQSLWNLQDRFTGWVDVPLTEQGESEARRAGELLRDIPFEVAYTSGLQRAQHTLRLVAENAHQHIPTIRNDALNERGYGDLEGLNKARTAEKFGADQVKIWRRSYNIPPPNGESLEMTAARTLPFFERCILGDIRDGRNVLVVAHGNSNRSIVMKLDGLSEAEVLELNLGTGVPLVYDLTPDGVVTSKRILSTERTA